MDTGTGDRVVRFADFALDPETGELWKEGHPVDLAPRPARLLALLAGSPGRIVFRDRIRREVWGDTVVDFDQAINNAVRQIREALGDDASDPRFVATVPRRGYRFIAELHARNESRSARGDGTEQSRRASSDLPGPPSHRGWAFVLVVAAAVVLGAAGWSLVTGSRDQPSGDAVTILAVVPARAATAGSEAEALADTLIGALTAAFARMDPTRIRVIPWTWDLDYDPATGGVSRRGEPVRVDFAAEANVYGDEGLEVAVFFTNVRDGRQVWHRRFADLPDAPGEAAVAIAQQVSATVEEHLDSSSPDYVR